MDPLSALVMSILGGVVAQALQSGSDLSDYYSETARGDLKPGPEWTMMWGSSVRWTVPDGEAVWIEAKYLRPIFGNTFDSEKLAAVRNGVSQARESLVFTAPYGQIQRIGISEISESIQYAEDYHAPPLTTGDDELDEYLADEESFKEEWGEEEARRASEEIDEALANGDGDFGQWMATVRDGNHRAFGAVLGGEEAIAIRIYDNDLLDIQGVFRGGGPRTGQDQELLALLEKAREDTEADPWWLPRFQALRDQRRLEMRAKISSDEDLLDEVADLFLLNGPNLSRHEEPIFAAVVEGRVVGGIAAGVTGGEMNEATFSVVVDEGFRRMGIARDLVQATKDWYVSIASEYMDAGEPLWQLRAWVINPHLIPLLESEGFDTEGEWSPNNPMMVWLQ